MLREVSKNFNVFQTIPSKRSSRIYFPSDIEREDPPHWKTAKPVIRVNTQTGEKTVYPSEKMPKFLMK